jgi:hypothetical protein
MNPFDQVQQVGEGTPAKGDPFPVGGQMLPGNFQCRRVPVQAQQAAVGGGGIQNGRRVSPSTHRPVNVDAAGPDLQKRKHRL